jgi:hypothetical protein
MCFFKVSHWAEIRPAKETTASNVVVQAIVLQSKQLTVLMEIFSQITAGKFGAGVVNTREFLSIYVASSVEGLPIPWSFGP